MDWSVDDTSYLKFKTWKLKCESILKGGLASLPDENSTRHFLDGQVIRGRKCTMLGVFTPVNLNRDTMDQKEEFCKPQANE